MGKKLSVMLKNIVGHWQNIVAALIKLSRQLQKLSGIYYISRMPGNVSVQNDNIGVWPGKRYYSNSQSHVFYGVWKLPVNVEKQHFFNRPKKRPGCVQICASSKRNGQRNKRFVCRAFFRNQESLWVTPFGIEIKGLVKDLIYDPLNRAL